MEPRIKNPATTLPGAMQAILALERAVEAGGVPRATIELCNLRASQINGCAVCLDMHSRALKKLGEDPENKDVLLLKDEELDNLYVVDFSKVKLPEWRAAWNRDIKRG